MLDSKSIASPISQGREEALAIDAWPRSSSPLCSLGDVSKAGENSVKGSVVASDDHASVAECNERRRDDVQDRVDLLAP